MAASVTATATLAAAGFDKRSSTSSSSLQTPGSGTFPSEMRSPMAASPSFQKQRENDLKTPITPPSAYLDFLKSMSPAMMSPAPTGTSTRFSFNADKCFDKASEKASDKSSFSGPMSQPPLSRNTSYDSTTSTATTSTTQSTASSNSAASTARRHRPESPRVMIPPSPFAKPTLPGSARTPRKLTIPQSPLSTAGLPSARSIASPYLMSSTPLSAAPWSASFSPRDIDTEVINKPGKMYVKQVVTRTVTYCRTPLDTVPDGNLWKRRKVEHDSSKRETTSAEPEIKQEKLEAVAEDSASIKIPTETAQPVAVSEEKPSF
ncbi:hypothetical protein BAUCODRAFT_329252 [Baudoinia panamericana UAMH 10762]|uniref:Uncharacterized protein n=1 Tax=Baudoinia panamericana (strain UAMH 10762) TaxID=717646 RepID=M2MYR6_BAUPA|nr:uncharacterized protein BAUCODRAFT_329252 [Baudoinia panamericana UAMH 10762]EMC91450.1 hypothetical protein BAUCODRAFT_329252 [Baudoinia panamericana UAMH 10762]